MTTAEVTGTAGLVLGLINLGILLFSRRPLITLVRGKARYSNDDDPVAIQATAGATPLVIRRICALPGSQKITLRKRASLSIEEGVEAMLAHEAGRFQPIAINAGETRIVDLEGTQNRAPFLVLIWWYDRGRSWLPITWFFVSRRLRDDIIHSGRG